jgi:hypothetical protein
MTEPTPSPHPLTDAVRRIVSLKDERIATLEALLRRWVERKKAEGGLLQDGLLEDTERELEGK